MLVSEQMNDALNEQVGNEFNSSLQYVAIASYFDNESLPELARHFYLQAEEERQHAMRFVKYIVDTDGKVKIPAIPQPLFDFSSAMDAVQHALDGERQVSEQINRLVSMAQEQGDQTTFAFLQWFVTEQLEEVSSMDTLLKIVQRAGEGGLLHVEEYLARNQSPSSSAGTA